MSRSNVLQSTESLIPTTAVEETADEVSPVAAPTTVDGNGLRPEDLQLAHDLCTPLTALKSALEILRQADLPAETDHMACIAQRNVERLALLIEAMLAQRTIKS